MEGIASSVSFLSGITVRVAVFQGGKWLFLCFVPILDANDGKFVLDHLTISGPKVEL